MSQSQVQSDRYNAQGNQPRTGIPRGLKILTIVLTVLKAMPWSLALYFTLYYLIVGRSTSRAGIDSLDVLDGASIPRVIVPFLLFMALSAAVLISQLWSALKANVRRLAIIAGILTVYDSIWAALALAGDSSVFGPALTMGSTFIAQAVIFGWAASLLWGPELRA